jgi:hypothetical protein
MQTGNFLGGRRGLWKEKGRAALPALKLDAGRLNAPSVDEVGGVASTFGGARGHDHEVIERVHD